jgi:hypothetical protein
MIMTFPARHAVPRPACPDENVMIIGGGGAGGVHW